MESLSITPLILPIGDFTFTTNRQEAQLNIQDDITALESANLAVLFAHAAVMTQSVGYDWVGFIEEKGLSRHFKITP